MSDKQKGKLDSRGTASNDDAFVHDFQKKMNEETIPAIIKDIKRNEQLVSEMRFSPKIGSETEA